MMNTNLDKFKDGLDQLISNGNRLVLSMLKEYDLKRFNEIKNKNLRLQKTDLPIFSDEYQNWYSESFVLIKQLLPDRLKDFVSLYERPKTKRKDIDYENYVIEDCLRGLIVEKGGRRIVEFINARRLFTMQLNILKSVRRRFESVLFDIKQLTQADLLDSELEEAKELNKNGYVRGAGAIAGVVLEKHLSQICINHNVKIEKKSPNISDLNDKLKMMEIYDVPIWRKIQHIGDLRNLCDHNKEREPTQEDVKELINGVDDIIKTVF